MAKCKVCGKPMRDALKHYRSNATHRAWLAKRSGAARSRNAAERRSGTNPNTSGSPARRAKHGAKNRGVGALPCYGDCSDTMSGPHYHSPKGLLWLSGAVPKGPPAGAVGGGGTYHPAGCRCDGCK